MRGVQAVFFDSGGTLAEPINGRWWPKPRFTEMLNDAGLRPPDDGEVDAALEAGFRYLHERRWRNTLDGEVDAYVGFYRIVLRTLFDDAPTPLCTSLATAAVYDQDQRPYRDTIPALDQLTAAGFRLGVISNAGPSLELRHRDMGLREYFDPFVISAVVGHEKPDPQVYRHTLNRAGLDPDEAVFVDDVPANVKTALGIGMTALVIDRAGTAAPGTISTLSELGGLLDLAAT